MRRTVTIVSSMSPAIAVSFCRIAGGASAGDRAPTHETSILSAVSVWPSTS